MGQHSFCGDCHGEWGCHDCQYLTAEYRHEQELKQLEEDIKHEQKQNAEIKRLRKIEKSWNNDQQLKPLLQEAVSILKAMKYDNKDFYKRANAAMKESNTKKSKKND